MLLQFTKLYNMTCMCRAVSTWGGVRRSCPPPPPTSFSKRNKVQQFHFHAWRILRFMGVKKFYGPEISRVLQCMLKYLDNSLTFFLTTKGKQITSRWTFWKGSILNARTSENFSSWTIRKKTTMNGILDDRLYVESWTYW